MLDIKLVRDDTEKVKKACRLKGVDPKVVDDFLEKDEKWRQLITKAQKLRQEHNEVSNKTKKEYTKEAISLALKVIGSQDKKDKDVAVVKEAIKQLKSQSDLDGEEANNLLYQIPNLPADDVPEGKDESENVEVKKWGKIPKFAFKPKDHLQLGEALDLIDVKRAAKVSGTRFSYLKNEAVLLEMALVEFGMKVLMKKGFIPVIPPVINKKEIERGLGYAEHGGWEQMYLFEKDKINFVSSSEHTIIPQHADEILKEEQLPLRYVGFSTCFRREAGSYGKDTRGLFRVHQFDKLEMNVFTVPDVEVSDKECLYLLSCQEELIQALKIPYRVVHCCTGDIPFPNRRMYDLEAWLPGQGRYREIQSCSNCTDFQTRRLNIKVRRKKGELEFAHALNATTLAIGRTIIAILENYQQKDGSVLIPKVLQKYVGKEKIIAKRKK